MVLLCIIINIYKEKNNSGHNKYNIPTYLFKTLNISTSVFCAQIYVNLDF